jgi:plasmid stability protein
MAQARQQPGSGRRSSFRQVGILVASEGRPGRQEPEAAFAVNAISDIIDCMASITIRRLPEQTKQRLRVRAARNGRSMEQEARELLETGLARADAEPENLGEAIRRRFAPLGGVDLKIPPRRGKIREIQFK